MKVLMIVGTACAPCTQMKPLVIEACDKAGIPLSILHHTSVDKQFMLDNQVRSVPFLAVLDKDDKVLRTATGMQTKAAIQTLLTGGAE